MSPTYTVEPDAYGDPTIWKHERDNDPRPAAVATDNRSSNMHPEAFRSAEILLAPDDAVKQLVEKAIKDAYYAARDNGGTMHTAAEDARDAVLAALKALATAGDPS